MTVIYIVIGILLLAGAAAVAADRKSRLHRRSANFKGIEEGLDQHGGVIPGYRARHRRFG